LTCQPAFGYNARSRRVSGLLELKMMESCSLNWSDYFVKCRNPIPHELKTMKSIKWNETVEHAFEKREALLNTFRVMRKLNPKNESRFNGSRF
jgi:hypothetical protein